jgi:hypothetical protein
MTKDCSLKVSLSQPYKPQIDFGYAPFSVLYTSMGHSISNQGPFTLKNANDTCIRDYYNPLEATITPQHKQWVRLIAENYWEGLPKIYIVTEGGFNYSAGMVEYSYRDFVFEGIKYTFERLGDNYTIDGSREFKNFRVCVNAHEFR